LTPNASALPPISWQILVVYAIGSILIDTVSNPQNVLPLALAPWTPSLSLSLAILLLYGSRYAPLLVITTFLIGLPIHDMPDSWLAALWASTLLMLGLLGISTWLKYGIKIDARLTSQRDLSWFLVAAAATALCDAGVHVFARAPEAAPDVWAWLADLINYWVSALIRILIVAPLVLVHARYDWATLHLWRPTQEMVLQALSIVAMLAIIFGLKYTDEFKFFYLLFLPLIWICMRHGIKGATIALAFTLIGINAILQWRGLRSVAVVEFQMLMLGLVITGLFLGMTVTARRAAEEKLHQREVELNQAMRLAGAGEMTQAIAHELNQPLSALANYARAARSMLAQPGEHIALLDNTLSKIDREATRAGQVVHRLRQFFRGGGLRLERVSATDLIEEGVAPVRRRLERSSIDIHIEPNDKLPDLLADRVQIGTVLHNLLVNATDALRQSTKARPTDVPETLAIFVSAKQADAQFIQFCIEDNGPGITPELQNNLFDSFVTSKPEGMGLGLPISRTLIEAHGGKLRLDSTKPARFCFSLPIFHSSSQPSESGPD